MAAPPPPPAPSMVARPSLRRQSTIAPGATADIQQEVLKALREEGEKLQQKITEIIAIRSRGGRTDIEDQMQQEQLEAKDALMQHLRERLNEEKQRVETGMIPLRNQVQELETEHAALKLEIQRTKAGRDHSDASILVAEVERAKEQQHHLLSQLQRLEANSFISKTDDRREANRRIKELEEMVKKKAMEHEALVESNTKADQARLLVVKDKQRLQEKQRDLRNRNERLHVDLEGQAAEIRRVEHEMRLMMERVPSDNQDALERALAAIVGDEAAAFTRLDRPDPAAVPSQQDLLSSDSLDRVIDRLTKERADLLNEIAVHRLEADREADASKQLRASQIKELAEARLKLRSHLQEHETWARLSAAHLSSIQDLQKRIQAFEAAGSTLATVKEDDAVSLGGFSDVSELEECQNALDIFLGRGEIDASAVHRFIENTVATSATGSIKTPQPVPQPEQIRTVVCADFRGFDAGYSAVTAGLHPAYDSLVSFGPFAADDGLLEHLSTGRLGVEVRATLPGGEQHVLGRGELPLAGLLRYVGQDTRNPVAGGVVSIRDLKDQDVLVARVFVKIRLRYSIEEMNEDYQQRSHIRDFEKKQLRRRLDANFGTEPNLLLVRIRRVNGLPPAPLQRPDELRPYVTYQVCGHPPHFTPTNVGSNPIFQDERVFEVRVDDSFCNWVESAAGLHFLVFDDASPSGKGQVEAVARAQEPQTLGLIGEVKVSLKPILRDANAVIEAPFGLARDLSNLASANVGTLEVTIFWQNFQAARAQQELKQPVARVIGVPIVQATLAPVPAILITAPAAPPGAMSDPEYQALLGRLVRRLAAQDIQSVESAFDHLDAKGNGAIQRQDFLANLIRMQMRISDDEATRLFSKLDADGDGTIILQELRSALARCTQADAPQHVFEAWVRDIFSRIREAMQRRTETSPIAIFLQLAQESTTPGSVRAGIDLPRFSRLLRLFRDDLTEAHLIHLWLMVDKDRNGLLTIDEFSDLFGATEGIMKSATSAMMTQDYFNIIAGRLLRHLMSIGLQSVEEIIHRYDADRDGRMTRAEFEIALLHDSPNLSHFERMQFINRLDADGDGIITVAELSIAFQLGGSQHQEAVKQAEAFFQRIRGAIARSGQTAQQVFLAICRGTSAMSRQVFEQLVKTFSPELQPLEVQQMWQLVDKNNDGCIAFEEFARCFDTISASTTAVTQPKQRAPPPPPLTAIGTPPLTPSHPPTPPPPTAQDPRSQMILGSIQKLIDKHGKPAARFFQGMDTNKDSKLSADEFASGLIALAVGEERSALRRFFLQIEGSVNGRLSITRLAEVITGQPATPPPPKMPTPPPPVPTQVVSQPKAPTPPLPPAALAAAVKVASPLPPSTLPPTAKVVSPWPPVPSAPVAPIIAKPSAPAAPLVVAPRAPLAPSAPPSVASKAPFAPLAPATHRPPSTHASAVVTSHAPAPKEPLAPFASPRPALAPLAPAAPVTLRPTVATATTPKPASIFPPAPARQ